MNAIADAYDDMRAIGRSPDRSVTVTLGGRGGVEVKLAEDVRWTHTEKNLERQVAGAARVALAAFQSQQQAAIDEAVERAWAAQ